MDKKFWFYTYPQGVEGFQQGFEQEQNPKIKQNPEDFYTYPQAYYYYYIISNNVTCYM